MQGWTVEAVIDLAPAFRVSPEEAVDLLTGLANKSLAVGAPDNARGMTIDGAAPDAARNVIASIAAHKRCTARRRERSASSTEGFGVVDWTRPCPPVYHDAVRMKQCPS